MSWLLSAWLISLGRNLQHYGINSKEVLIDNKVNQEINNPQALYERAKQNFVRSQIESIVNELKRERDPYIVIRLESKLKSLATDLTEEDRRILSVDDLLIQLREDRVRGFNRK